jgi:hypothetical protein
MYVHCTTAIYIYSKDDVRSPFVKPPCPYPIDLSYLQYCTMHKDHRVLCCLQTGIFLRHFRIKQAKVLHVRYHYLFSFIKVIFNWRSITMFTSAAQQPQPKDHYSEGRDPFIDE